MDRTSTPNQPLETLRDGRLKSIVWESTGENGKYHTVTLSKVYEDRDGKLQESGSFSAGELLRVAELARESHALVRDLRREQGLDRQSEPRADRAERPAPSREKRPERFRGRAQPGLER